MVVVLWISVSILLACLVAVMSYAVAYGWIVRSKDIARYRLLQSRRDEGRTPKSVERIFAEEWCEPTTDIGCFRQRWTSLASRIEIDPELLRPDDRLDDVMVSTGTYGPGSEDLAEFVLDWLPHADPFDVLADVGLQDQSGTVRDIINAVTFRPR